MRSQSPNKRKGGAGGLSPKLQSPKIEQGIKGKYGAISDMENRLMDAERQNKELQKEIKLLQRIQDRQGNALEKMNENGYQERQVNQFIQDLRVQKEKNKQLKA